MCPFSLVFTSHSHTPSHLSVPSPPKRHRIPMLAAGSRPCWMCLAAESEQIQQKHIGGWGWRGPGTWLLLRKPALPAAPSRQEGLSSFLLVGWVGGVGAWCQDTDIRTGQCHREADFPQGTGSSSSYFSRGGWVGGHSNIEELRNYYRSTAAETPAFTTSSRDVTPLSSPI